jgi:hypothetical protein
MWRVGKPAQAPEQREGRAAVSSGIVRQTAGLAYALHGLSRAENPLKPAQFAFKETQRID